MKYVTKEFHEKNTKSQIKSGDILIARHGENGLACLIPENFGDANCLNVVLIRPNRDTLDSTYLFYDYFRK
jgi:type I restriction enzyme S subunit